MADCNDLQIAVIVINLVAIGLNTIAFVAGSCTLRRVRTLLRNVREQHEELAAAIASVKADSKRLANFTRLAR